MEECLGAEMRSEELTRAIISAAFEGHRRFEAGYRLSLTVE